MVNLPHKFKLGISQPSNIGLENSCEPQINFWCTIGKFAGSIFGLLQICFVMVHIVNIFRLSSMKIQRETTGVSPVDLYLLCKKIRLAN